MNSTGKSTRTDIKESETMKSLTTIITVVVSVTMAAPVVFFAMLLVQNLFNSAG